MGDKILVITSSILDQGVLPQEKLTPYYEIRENLPAEEMELIISEIAETLRI